MSDIIEAINEGREICARDGSKVSNLTILEKPMAHGEEIIGVVDNQFAYRWLRNGKLYGLTYPNKHDLVVVPRRIKGWINVYNVSVRHSAVYADKQTADYFAHSDRIACVYIDVVEGEGLE